MLSKYYVIVPVAGKGSRFGSTLPKQYTLINGISILEHTLSALLLVDRIEQIILVASPDDNNIDVYQSISPKLTIHKVGGITRAHSVINGLKKLNCHAHDWVLVHDAARCCITPKMVNMLIDKLSINPVGGILAHQSTDTVKYVTDNVIDKTIPRECIYLAQTPQMFRYHILYDALDNADLSLVTDEASAVEQLGLTVQIIINDNTNIKVTYPHDIKLAELLLMKNHD